jgi:hypothetical protein
MNAFLAAALARAGRKDEARSILKGLLEQQHRFGMALNIAIEEALGDKEAAYVWLEKALVEKEPLMLVVGSAFISLPSLRAENRFERLLKSIRGGEEIPAGAS